MATVLTIDGTDYDNMDRPALAVRLNELLIDLEGGYDQMSFAEVGMTMVPTWTPHLPVSVTFGGDLVFSGTIGDMDSAFTDTGWTHSYRCLDIKHLADQVNVTGIDQTGTISFNRSPEDPYYTASESGLDCGQIIQAVLEIQATADALDARGVGAYTSLSPPTLPTVTADDLDLLTIVPPQQVTLSGEGVLNQLEQFLMHWMPKWRMKILPDGTIRFLDTTDLTASGRGFQPRDIFLPGGTTPDPVFLGGFRISTSRCATRMVIRGAAEVEATLLSTADGTLEPAWSGGDESAWTLHDYTDPVDATSEGTTSSVTGSSVVVNPTSATASWASNFWSGRQAWIYLFDDVASGITMTEARPVTSNTACSAGGTCTVTWDSGWPISGSGFNRYRLVGGAGSRNDVGRLYNVREPNGPDLATDTFVGAHLVRRSQLPIRWANNSRSIDVFYPTGIIRWNTDGDPDEATVDMPATVEVLPRDGQFRFTEPVVKVFGNTTTLNLGWPATADDGLPADVQVLALYSRGTLEAIVPADVLGVPQYEGTAASAPWNLELTKVIDVPAWMNRGDFTRMVELAQEHLDAIKDVVFEGSFDWYGIPGWDFLTDRISVNFVVDGGNPTGLEDINAPVRSVRLRWPEKAGSKHLVTFSFSTQRRPYSGDDLHIPAAFSGDNFFSRNTDPFGELYGPAHLPSVFDQGANLAKIDIPSMGQNQGLGPAGNLAGQQMGNYNLPGYAQELQAEGQRQQQQTSGPSGAITGTDPWQDQDRPIDARPTDDWRELGIEKPPEEPPVKIVPQP